LTENKEFKTLLQEVREKKPPKMNHEDRKYWNMVKAEYEVCPYREDDLFCKWSKKFREAGPISCSGWAYARCPVFMKMRKSGEDPSVLIK